MSILITANLNQANGITMPSGFVGLSLEKYQMNQGYLNVSNTNLINLFKLLGPSVLRIGGNTVDTTVWTPGGAGRTSGQIAPADVDALSAFLAAVNWKCIYGVACNSNTATLAAQEATYANSSLGSSLYTLSIGNEPEFYVMPYGSNYAAFVTQWQLLATAIKSAVPTILLDGPQSSTFDSYAATYCNPFISTGSAGMISLATCHYYFYPAPTSQTQGVTDLITPDSSIKSVIKTMSATCKAAGLSNGPRIAECNTFAGGYSGVSNTLVSALWLIDYVFNVLNQGASGINLHGNTGATYSPISESNAGTVTAVNPIFHAMLMLSNLGNGPVLPVSVINPSGLNFNAYAIKPHGVGSANIILNNKDTSNTATVTLQLPPIAYGGSLPTFAYKTLLLTGASLTDTSTVTLGSSQVSTTGSWTPTYGTGTYSGNSLTISVPPNSALLIIPNTPGTTN